jgi:hypothetical protein
MTIVPKTVREPNGSKVNAQKFAAFSSISLKGKYAITMIMADPFFPFPSISG